MKMWTHKTLMLGLIALALFSCKKDEMQAVATKGTNPTLIASANAVTLTKTNENANALTFNFTKPDFGYSAAVTYTLQFAKPGTAFANASTITLPSNATTQSITQRAMNIAALNAGLDTTTAAALQVRLKADIGSGQAPVYSNVVDLNVKAYSLNSFLFVPGDYQGWNPGGAPKLISINSTGNYEGFVNLTASGYQGFKFTDAPSWNGGIYGDAAGSGTSGVIGTPGNDIKFTNPGYYYLKVDLNNKVYTATKTTWSVIGDGAAGWGSDVAMTYDAANSVWKVTTTLTAGKEMKFRANNDWTINLGVNTGNSLKFGGDNIAVTSGGTKTITLNLSNPGAYTYTIN